jgi:hypothetical protein
MRLPDQKHGKRLLQFTEVNELGNLGRLEMPEALKQVVLSKTIPSVSN